MSDYVWVNLIDALGTVLMVAAALAYLAWDRLIDYLEDQAPGKGQFDDDWS